MLAPEQCRFRSTDKRLLAFRLLASFLISLGRLGMKREPALGRTSPRAIRHASAQANLDRGMASAGVPTDGDAGGKDTRGRLKCGRGLTRTAQVVVLSACA